MSESQYCGRCGNEMHSGAGALSSHAMMKNCWDQLWGKWICNKCYNELYDRDAKAREAAKREEQEQERAARDAEKSARIKEQERAQREERERNEAARRRRERELDATLPWYECCHCGESEREDRCHRFKGEKLCQSCFNKLQECGVCGEEFVQDKEISAFEKNEDGSISYGTLCFCPSCMPGVRKRNPDWFNQKLQRELCARYNKKVVKENNKAVRREAAVKSSFIIFLIATLIEMMTVDCFDWKFMLGTLLGTCLLAVIFPVIMGWLSRVLLLSIALTGSLGVIVGAVCWFKMDAFLVPLGISGIAFLVLTIILESTGFTTERVENDEINALQKFDAFVCIVTAIVYYFIVK